MVAHWLAELDGRRVAVEVPASSANLGAGYDCLGRRARADQPGRGRGPRLEPRRDRADRRRRGPRRADRGPREPVRPRARGGAREGRGELPDGVGWRIEMRNQIPLARGLGSSAAATVGGVVAGERARSASRCRRADLLGSRPTIEGHPDNAAAALLGGFVVSALDAGRRRGRPVRRAARPAGGAVHPGPAPVDRRDARGAAREGPARGRRREPRRRGASASPGSPPGRFDLLARLTVDRLHEPYRAEAYPQLPRLVAAAREAGRARRLPVGRGLDDPRLRRFDGRHRPHRGRLRGRGRRHRPRRAGPGRRAAQRRGAGGVGRLTPASSAPGGPPTVRDG